MRRGPSWIATSLGALFFLSGAAGLVYEVLWFRLLVLKLGGTGLSVATVTAAFMAGLGFGAWLFGTRLALRAHPMRLYALLEGLIGAYALLVPSLIGWAGRLDAALLGAEPGGAGRVIRFLLAGAVLLPATSCMGGTLPVLARLAGGKGGAPARFVGLLYGLNTTGAVLGAGIAGFVLMPRAGLAGTIRLAAALNLLLGAAAFLLASRAGVSVEGPRREEDVEEEADHLPLAVATSSVSGFVAFVLQVSWTRILALTFGSSVYAFSLILVIFLLGLGAGALVGAWISSRARSARRALAWCFLATGATALLGQGLYSLLPGLYLEALRGATERHALGGAAWLAGALMLPPTLFLGLAFPFVVRLATGNRGHAASAGVGRIYAGNTLGSVAGAFSAALSMIPAFGLSGAVTVASLLALGLAVFLAIEHGSWRAGRAATFAPPAAAAGVLLLWLVAVPGWDRGLMSTGVGIWGPRAYAAGRDVKQDLRALAADRILFYRDGVTATVTVKEAKAGDRVHRYMSIDGKIDASNGSDMPTQVLLGQFPFFGTRAPGARVLVIGYASGVTVGSALTHEVGSITVVEIEGQVEAASHFFDEINGRPLQDRRVRLVVNDARAYLERADQKFDVVISEPSSVWLTGPSKLFTRETFETIHGRLATGGVLAQWLHTYDLAPEDIWTVIRTLREVFPHVALMTLIEDADLLLLASDAPILLDLERIEGALRDPKIEADLRRVGVLGVCGVLDRVVAEPAAVDAVLGPGPINTDDNAWLEYRGALAAGNRGERESLAVLAARSLGAAAILDWGASPGVPTPGALAATCREEGAARVARSLARRAQNGGPDADAFWVLGEEARDHARQEEALQRFGEALRVQPGHRRSLVSIALSLQEMNRLPESLRAWNRAAEVITDDAIVPAYRGVVKLQTGDLPGALADFRTARALTGARPTVIQLDLYEACALQELGRHAEAKPLLERLLSGTPPDAGPTPETVAALERLSLALSHTPGGQPHADDLRRRASAARGGLVPSILSEVGRILGEAGEIPARAYLRDITRLDPALLPELRRGAGALQDGPLRARLSTLLGGS